MHSKGVGKGGWGRERAIWKEEITQSALARLHRCVTGFNFCPHYVYACFPFSFFQLIKKGSNLSESEPSGNMGLLQHCSIWQHARDLPFHYRNILKCRLTTASNNSSLTPTTKNKEKTATPNWRNLTSMLQKATSLCPIMKSRVGHVDYIRQCIWLSSWFCDQLVMSPHT